MISTRLMDGLTLREELLMRKLISADAKDNTRKIKAELKQARNSIYNYRTNYKKVRRKKNGMILSEIFVPVMTTR